MLKIFKWMVISVQIKDSQRVRHTRKKSRIHILHMAFWSLLFVSLSPFQQKHRIRLIDFTELPQCPSTSFLALHLLQEQEHGKVQAGCTKTHASWTTVL